jgi:hypothetical protein
MNTIKFPVSFKNGSLVTIEENTDEYWSQFLGMLVRVETGELPLEPTYGINDPIFSTIDAGRVKLASKRFYPEVEIISVNIGQASFDGTQKLNINFSY